MTQTLQDIRDHVRGVMDVDDVDLTDDVLDVYIRQGSHRIEKATHNWPLYENDFSFTTVANTSDYTFATIGATLALPSRLRGPNHEMVYIGPDEADRSYPRNVTTTGDPYYWTVRGRTTLTVYPTPNAAYTINIRGYRTPTDWVSLGTGGTPDMPDEFQDLLALWALNRAYAQQEDLELATFYAEAFNTELRLLTDREDGAPPAQPLLLNARASAQTLSLSRGRWPWE